MNFSKSNIQKALEMGKEAFHNGKKSIPVFDPNLMQLLKENDQEKKPFGSSSQLLNAWSTGWHQENIKQNY